MLEIDKTLEGSNLTVVPVGRVDAITAPELDDMLMGSLGGVTDLTIDMAGVTYLSSAGIRTLLRAAKAMRPVGTFALTNVSLLVRDALEITGFDQVLNIVS